MADIEKVTKSARKVARRATNGEGPLGNPAGLAAAGAALAAVPFAIEKLAQAVGPKASGKAAELADEAKDKAKSQIKDKAKDIAPDSPSDLIGGGNFFKKVFGGGDDGASGNGDQGQAAPGHGSGRRMPIQQSVDVAVPVKTAYNHWTEFEDWPEFMHRIESVDQVDDATVSFQAKIWGVNKRFEADIVEQHPDERIEWNVTEGYAHTGVVTFHPLAKNLTRIDLTLDVQPSNIIDKASRGMRFVKRAVRGDLHRFKAYVELDKEDKAGSRKTIEEGRVKRTRSNSRSGSARRRNGSARSKSKAGSRGKAKGGSQG